MMRLVSTSPTRAVSDVVTVPRNARDAVIRRVYADAQKAGWEHLTQDAKARWYDRWTSDEQVGGILASHLGPERVRTWLKDGPLKHYATARSGIGPYAKFADVTGPTPQRVAKAVLGKSWAVDESTITTKPLRFQATRGDDRAVVAYGPSRKFRDLLWAALNDAVDVRTPSRAVVAIVDDDISPTPHSERHQQQRIADRCNIEIRWAALSSTTAHNASP